MFQLIVENLGAAAMAAAGLLTAAVIIADHVKRALTSWEPLLVDRGEIVDGGDQR